MKFTILLTFFLATLITFVQARPFSFFQEKPVTKTVLSAAIGAGVTAALAAASKEVYIKKPFLKNTIVIGVQSSWICTLKTKSSFTAFSYWIIFPSVDWWWWWTFERRNKQS